MPTKTGLSFDGNDSVSVPSSSLINTGSSYPERTIEAWVKTGTDIQAVQCVYEEGGSGRGYGVYVSGGSLFVGSWLDAAVASLSYPVSPDTVYRVALVDSSSNFVSIYIDGVSQGTVSHQGMLTHSDAPSIGAIASNSRIPPFTQAQSGGAFLLGFTGYLRLWNFARTEAQVQADMNGDLVGSEPGLILAYNMDEGSGTTLTDVSPNALSGTISGATWSSVTYGTPPAAPTGLTAVRSVA